MLEGYDFRQRRDDAKTAYFVSLLLNVSGKSYKKTVTGKDLLKPLYPPKGVAKNKKADEAYLREQFKLGK